MNMEFVEGSESDKGMKLFLSANRGIGFGVVFTLNLDEASSNESCLVLDNLVLAVPFDVQVPLAANSCIPWGALLAHRCEVIDAVLAQCIGLHPTWASQVSSLLLQHSLGHL